VFEAIIIRKLNWVPPQQQRHLAVGGRSRDRLAKSVREAVTQWCIGLQSVTNAQNHANSLNRPSPPTRPTPFSIK